MNLKQPFGFGGKFDDQKPDQDAWAEPKMSAKIVGFEILEREKKLTVKKQIKYRLHTVYAFYRSILLTQSVLHNTLSLREDIRN